MNRKDIVQITQEDWCKACEKYSVLETKFAIAVEALKQCKIYSECYEELILTIDTALRDIM